MKRQRRCTLGEAIDFCLELGLQISDGEYIFYHWEGNGWTNKGRRILDWRATVRAWNKAGYLPSQRNAPKLNPVKKLKCYCCHKPMKSDGIGGFIPACKCAYPTQAEWKGSQDWWCSVCKSCVVCCKESILKAWQ